jgi:GH25 family lysozyme M1 (1,4-beta-N-acetylmuramidase)
MLSLLQRIVSLAAPKHPVGVDVSSFQGPPGTWSKEAGKITWAAVKVTELEPGGTHYANPDAKSDWAFLARKKHGRVAYMFGHPSTNAASSVNFFVSELKKIGLRDSDAIALDLEVTDGRTPHEVSAWAVAVMADLAGKLKRRPVLYTFLSFAEEGNCHGLGKYPLWIADPSSKAGKPHVPKPWNTWTIHQYDITGPIDRDVANYRTQAAMAAALGKHEEPDLKKIGGSIAGPVAVARWESSVTVVAGTGTDGFVQVARWSDGEWSAWKDVSPTKAEAGPGVVAWGENDGRLYYTDQTGTVCILVTSDAGQTWI